MWQRSVTGVCGWISASEAGCFRTTGPASIPGAEVTGVVRAEQKGGGVAWRGRRASWGPQALEPHTGKSWDATAETMVQTQSTGPPRHVKFNACQGRPWKSLAKK